MSDDLFHDKWATTYADVARVVGRFRAARWPGADDLERVLLAGLPPREPGMDDEAGEARAVPLDADEAPIGAVVSMRREVADGGGKRSVADLIKAGAGGRRRR